MLGKRAGTSGAGVIAVESRALGKPSRPDRAGKRGTAKNHLGQPERETNTLKQRRREMPAITTASRCERHVAVSTPLAERSRPFGLGSDHILLADLTRKQFLGKAWSGVLRQLAETIAVMATQPIQA